MATQKRLAANKKYNAEKYDEIKLRVPKGQREKVQAFAEENGESTNAFLNRLIREAMENTR